MGAIDLLEHLSGIGLTVNLAGDELQVGPRAALTDDARALIRTHKGELIAALKPEPIPEAEPPEAGARRQRVLAMLENNSVIRYAMTTDVESDPHAVIVTLAIRDFAECEFVIPMAKYDPFTIMKAVETLQ
jgi:hypothetical protein